MESTDPVAMLKEDHSNVKDLFNEFEKTDDERTQMQIAKRAINELKVHAAIEEEIFYPGVREQVDDAELMSEATEEHHVVHFLIDELEGQNLDHDTFHAKFIVLAENVRHHIKEEEGEMLPKIDSDEDEMQQLARRMAERKQQLMENPDALNRKTSRSKSPRAGNKKSGKSETSRSRPSSPRASR
jgi:hemerythrin superfamily protein